MFYEKELKALKKVNRFRKRNLYKDDLIDLASNDYLGLASNKKILKKAYKAVKKEKSNSSKASIIVNGYSKIHKKFEDKLCKLNKFEAGIVVGSGFLANIALIESMVRKGDILFIDEDYHASGILAAKLVQGEVVFFKHNDYLDLEDKIKSIKVNGRILIAIEGVYSMGGDIAPKQFVKIANKHNAILIVDEAHSSGVIGKNLSGWFDYWNIKPKSNHIKMGTLGKAYGSYGAYILASKHIVSYLENRAKPIIYSTAPSHFDISLAYCGLKYISKHKKQIKNKIQQYQQLIQSLLNINTQSLIVPIIINNNKKVMQIQKELINNKLLLGAIRQPTVSKAMLRLILKLDIERDKLIKTCKIINNKIQSIL
ncbi:MAG: pyridoxal phosphate-dependent aminotransferase family protein [Arcobacteraceae bacterium]|nr:pyridoxal phosphate-dependent aminotransferase family protein [Arcobacteraceae bacterium]